MTKTFKDSPIVVTISGKRAVGKSLLAIAISKLLSHYANCEVSSYEVDAPQNTQHLMQHEYKKTSLASLRRREKRYVLIRVENPQSMHVR